jgi:hypothetical protein
VFLQYQNFIGTLKLAKHATSERLTKLNKIETLKKLLSHIFTSIHIQFIAYALMQGISHVKTEVEYTL